MPEAPRAFACRGPATRPGDVIRLGCGTDVIEAVVLKVEPDGRHPDSHAYISYRCPDGSIGGGIFPCSTVHVVHPVGAVGNCADCVTWDAGCCETCMGTGEAIGSRTCAYIVDLEREREVLIDERDRVLGRLDAWSRGGAL